MNIAVAGTGYVGLVSAVCFADKGFNVTCVDVDEDKIAKMQGGVSPIFENGLEELMHKNASRLTYTTNYRQAYGNADVVFVGVGTPEKSDGSANMQYVNQVLSNILQSLSKDIIVVIKSTVPIGTNLRVKSFFANAPFKVDVVSNPEFLAQGTAVKDTLYPSRIIIGADSQSAIDKMLALYADFDAPKLVMNNTSAEMVKYASNDFLALKLSFINEIANVCEIVGANIDDVVQGMGKDSRIGSKFLQAGIGYGGSCFPKDTKALHWLANSFGYELKTIKAAIDVNENQKLKLLKKAERFYESFNGLRVAVLGVTFKPNTDDLREAPSIPNVQFLIEENANVIAFDPVGQQNFSRLFPSVTFMPSIEQAIENADVCFIFTEWQQIVEFDVAKYKQLMRRAIVLDGRNCYSPKRMAEQGIEYCSIGRGAG